MTSGPGGTYLWTPREAMPRALPCGPHSPAGPVGLLRGPGWARGIASGRKSSFQGGGVLWGTGRSLSGLEGRSAASSRRTWAREGQRVRPGLGQGHMWTGRGPVRPAAAPAGLGSPSSVGPHSPGRHALPPLPSSPSRFRRALLDPQAQAGPHGTPSEPGTFFLEGPPLGLEI